jgi:integrase
VGRVADATGDATLPALGNVAADMVRLQRLTGMRPGEVCAMTVRQVDMSDEICRLASK